MRRFITTLFICGLTLGIMAQTALRGKILSDDGHALAGAKITLANQNISTTTNASGEFTLIYLEPIDEEMLIEANGFITDVQLVSLKANEQNDLGSLSLKRDIQREVEDEIVVQLSELELSDDDGRTQTSSSGSNASNDVFNSGTGFAWSTVRYRQRGYDQIANRTYINGLSFNGLERGTFSYGSLGGLNDASRNKDEANSFEANNYSFGGIGRSTNIMMEATRFAQGWKIGVSGTNRTYKGRAYLTYATGLRPSGWAFAASAAWRYSPYIDQKGIIGEGIKYNSFGYFFSAQKKWGDRHSLNILTFGAPTNRGQSAAVTEEVTYLTNSVNYNPYWGYQNGKVRNSRIVKSFDPTLIVNYEWKISDTQTFKAAIGYHYSLYSNSALTFYNAPDPRPDYYRNLPTFLYDGQISTNDNPSTIESKEKADNQVNQPGWFIDQDLAGRTLGEVQYYHGLPYGSSIDENQFKNLVDLWVNRDDQATQINWDKLYAANYANDIDNANDPYRTSRYMLERRHNDLQETSASINYQSTKTNHLKLTAGLELKSAQGIHYKTVDDLLGGTQWYDIDPFAERDIKDLASNIGMTQDEIERVKLNDINKTAEERVVKTGDKFGYDYRINMNNVRLWAQNEWSWNEVDLYYALQVTYSDMQRTSNMINGRAWYLSTLNNGNMAQYYLGRNYKDILNGSATESIGYLHQFVDPSFKAGLTYKINGRNRIKFNALAETQAPYARDAYISQRVHDRVLNTMYQHAHAKDLKDFYAPSEKIVGGDLTYEFNYPIIRGRVTAYYTRFWDGSQLNGYYDDDARTFVNQSITGIGRAHCGIEAAAAIKLGNYFTLTPMVAVGDFRYTNNAYSITSAENGMKLDDIYDNGTTVPLYEIQDSILIKGFKVAAGPQVNASLKLSFFHSKMWFADLTVSYFDKSYLGYAASRRMQGLFTGTRADGTIPNGTFVSANAVVQTTDENGEAIAVLDKYGTPELKYPYDKMVEQESLTSEKVWHRFMIDASVGKLIYLPNRQSLSINLSISNLTNNINFKTGGYQQARLPRQNLQGKDRKASGVEDSRITPNAWKFPSKFYYAWGTNFYLSVTYKF